MVAFGPWNPNGKNPTSAAKASAASVAPNPTAAQLATLESNLEKKLSTDRKKTKDGDVPMDPDAVEQHLAQLEAQFQHVPAAQASTFSHAQSEPARHKCLAQSWAI